ncbi:bifunctional 2-polyprenyl-6-hydroxyphenol methylase/3-demethylubiquinol 3-O-methyltransferase UbiG [Paenibacillus sp. NEAU-GSW1]|uniref:class I SAM-dependent methyltransferase n=1 Tax=Paenibacillus sp. NEAU-GSW1 TaxID=2682486 RepID=UPI0012E1705D|nr:class I SAM-dependent methyltransferase [Paenibacillus sp. NEAU-GSW1]MUT68299.1 methyltransferase domain-containing protein [Paenibacillus sp. NEAU-GSW1]
MNQWNERFGMNEYIYGEEPNAFIVEQADRFKGKRIVAFAEGEGRNAVHLARQGYQVTAWDYAENGLKKTEQLAERFHVKVETELKDLLHDAVPSEAYDGAFMIFGHFPKAEQKNVFDKLLAVVKPGGVIVMEVYSEDQLRYQTGGPRTADMLYHPADVLAWTSGCEVLHFFYGEQKREEGRLHTGVGHVIQTVLIKNPR